MCAEAINSAGEDMTEVVEVVEDPDMTSLEAVAGDRFTLPHGSSVKQLCDHLCAVHATCYDTWQQQLNFTAMTEEATMVVVVVGMAVVAMEAVKAAAVAVALGIDLAVQGDSPDRLEPRSSQRDMPARKVIANEVSQ